MTASALPSSTTIAAAPRVASSRAGRRAGEGVRAQALACDGCDPVSSPLADRAPVTTQRAFPALPQTPPITRFARYAWAVLAWNVGVVLWGAFVRASGSGAGCGNHWPVCNGQVIPQAPSVKTLIELTHRVMTGVDTVLVIALVWLAWRLYAKGSPVRTGAALSLFFLVTEALVGAALVKWIALLLLPLAAVLWLRRHRPSVPNPRRTDDGGRTTNPFPSSVVGRPSNPSSVSRLPSSQPPLDFGRGILAAQLAALAIAATLLAHLPYGDVPRALAAPLATQSSMKAENTLGALAIGGSREVLIRLGDASAQRPEWRRAADSALGMAGRAAVLLALLVAAYAIWRRPTFTRFLEAGGWLFVAMLLAATVFRVWYVIWPLALVALLDWRPLTRIVVAFSASAPLIYLHWGTHGWSDVLVYVPVLVLIARHLWRERRRHRARVMALWVSRGAAF